MAALNEPERIVITDDEQRIVFCNNAWTAFCGHTKEQSYGKTCALLQGPETDQKALCMLRKGLAANQTTTVRLANYSRLGHRFTQDLTVERVDRFFLGTIRPVPVSTAEKWRSVARKLSRADPGPSDKDAESKEEPAKVLTEEPPQERLPAETPEE